MVANDFTAILNPLPLLYFALVVVSSSIVKISPTWYPDPLVIFKEDTVIAPLERETVTVTPLPLPVNDFNGRLLLLVKSYPSPALITS